MGGMPPPKPYVDTLPIAHDIYDYTPRKYWMKLGLCYQTWDDRFFNGRKDREAIAICDKCPVIKDCLADAVADANQFGVRGGLSESSRKKLKRQVSKLRRENLYFK